MKSDFMEYANYPFDQPIFKYKFELSTFDMKFNGKKVDYRFDFYEQSNNSIAYKEDVDNIPELDIDFLNPPYLETCEDHTKLEKNKITGKCMYYPGFTLIVNAVRDPYPKIIRIFLPLLILGMFLCMTFEVEEYHDRLNNLAICLLTFITIMETTRQELPDIAMFTVSDKYLIAYMWMSLTPIIDRALGIGSKSRCELYSYETEYENSHC